MCGDRGGGGGGGVVFVEEEEVWCWRREQVIEGKGETEVAEEMT